MMKKVTKAVIPAAGLGTRVLPATKAMPKGMLPIVDKPAIQYLVEEAVRSGITDILIILGRNQSIIEDHFDRSPELEEKLAKPGKEKALEECLGIANMANILFVRQKQTLGLGHAVNTAKAFTGDDPFVVIYGDDVIWGEDPVCAQLIRAYEEFGRPAAGVSAVPWEDVSRYCSLKTTPIHDNYFFVDDMIEKPKKGQEFSNYSILGRVLLTPEIYEILAHTKPGAGGEIQLTDAMAEYARTRGGMTAVEFTGKHYDMGNKLKVVEGSGGAGPAASGDRRRIPRLPEGVLQDTVTYPENKRSSGRPVGGSFYCLPIYLTGVLLRRHLGKECLEHQRRCHAGHHDQQDHSGKVDRVHHADIQALLGHDQCHLAAGHHANADLEGVAPVEAADLGRKAAADDLGDKCYNDEADTEQERFPASGR